MPSSACKKSARSEEHTSELQSHDNLVCRLLLEKKNLQMTGADPADARRNTHDIDAPPVLGVRSRARSGAANSGWRCSPRSSPSFFFFFNDRPPTGSLPLSHPGPLQT